jgi:Na+/H+-translocating membrane pyrophosphatase
MCRYMFVCVACGLWGGLAIGLQTEYFTSNRYRPVQVRTHILGIGLYCRSGEARRGG